MARLLRDLADGDDEARQLALELVSHGGDASIIGVTGAPGVGKSCLIARLVERYRARGLRVAVLAFDPSSPISGGALLGDRLRLGERALDDGVFVHSVASRGHLGGTAPSALWSTVVLDASGFEVILVETVGVGQSESEVSALASTTVLMVGPESGDSVQALKGGIIELADVLVVNKRDRPGAALLAAQLQEIASSRPRAEGEGRTPILETNARTGDGVELLVETIEARASETGPSSQSARWSATLVELVTASFRRALSNRCREELDEAALRLSRRERDPNVEAAALLRLTLKRLTDSEVTMSSIGSGKEASWPSRG